MNEHIKVFLRIKPNVENFTNLINEDCTIYKNSNNTFAINTSSIIKTYKQKRKIEICHFNILQKKKKFI
ncbi:hypothetical protein PFBG_03648 [Plasmodium falciparum 7G8]|uniref:Uncharacterized protein n=1 Tax=Plasmodium falciparum (isolate 7G8) TaxID=57266 RepID=W7F5B8_PLAF8|nr:hypothetical protein PFBG_03648 [Plasmodium falciparum 7G8]